MLTKVRVSLIAGECSTASRGPQKTARVCQINEWCVLVSNQFCVAAQHGVHPPVVDVGGDRQGLVPIE